MREPSNFPLTDLLCLLCIRSWHNAVTEKYQDGKSPCPKDLKLTFKTFLPSAYFGVLLIEQPRDCLLKHGDRNLPLGMKITKRLVCAGGAGFSCS